MASVEFIIQPPAQTRPDDILYPPPVAKISHASGDLWAYVTLVDSGGQIVHSLIAGTLLDSAQPLPILGGIPNYPTPNRGDSYVVFPNLSIRAEGYYRIRLTLMSNSGVGTSSLEEVESRTVTVRARISGSQDLSE